MPKNVSILKTSLIIEIKYTTSLKNISKFQKWQIVEMIVFVELCIYFAKLILFYFQLMNQTKRCGSI